MWGLHTHTKHCVQGIPNPPLLFTTRLPSLLKLLYILPTRLHHGHSCCYTVYPQWCFCSFYCSWEDEFPHYTLSFVTSLADVDLFTVRDSVRILFSPGNLLFVQHSNEDQSDTCWGNWGTAVSQSQSTSVDTFPLDADWRNHLLSYAYASLHIVHLWPDLRCPRIQFASDSSLFWLFCLRFIPYERVFVYAILTWVINFMSNVNSPLVLKNLRF